MKVLKSGCQGEIIVKKSKFIANGFEVNSIDEAQKFILDMKKKYHDAKHNTYAYILEDGYLKSSDDGEPHGTAGIQILNVLKAASLENSLITVTRYFGGVLLGAGYLARTYFSAANILNSENNFVIKKLCNFVRFSCEYEVYGKILNLLNFFNVKILESNFTSIVDLYIAISDESFIDFSKKCSKILGKEAKLNVIRQKYL